MKGTQAPLFTYRDVRMYIKSKLALVTSALTFSGLCATVFANTSNENTISYDIKTSGEHAASILDNGVPGIGPDGLKCVRSGSNIWIIHGNNISEQKSFDEIARMTINRDIFLNEKWDGSWDKSKFVDNTIQFDDYGTAYTLIIPRYSNLKKSVLLYSTDGCNSWKGVILSGRNATLERRTSATDSSHPPTILSYDTYGKYRSNNLWMDLFKMSGDNLARRNSRPLLVSSDSLLVANHSGGGNSTLTRPGRIFVVYPTTNTSESGTQSVSREFDLESWKWLGPEIQIGRSTTPGRKPDNHDLPALARLPSGQLIVAVGAHHSLFKIHKSLARDSTLDGWDDGEIVGSPNLGPDFQQYSYLSLNVSRSGTINIISRSEGRNFHYDLVQFRKTLDGRWGDGKNGIPHRKIATPNRQSYAAWRQQVSESPDGTLYLHFSYFPNKLTDSEARKLSLNMNSRRLCDKHEPSRCWYPDAPDIKPVTLISHDDGKTWR